MIKVTLEQRIARLEKLVSKYAKKITKNEAKISDKSDFLVGSIVEDLNGYESVVIDMGSFRDMYDKWYNRLMPVSREEIDDHLMEFDGEDWVDDAFTVVTKFEDGGIAMSTDPESELEVFIVGGRDDYEPECNNRRCESHKITTRTRKVESSRPLKCTKNEAVKQLPNGMTANNVADVLSSFAGTSLSNPKAAIAKLDRMGILDASTNKWYPAVEDVADAIEDCWDDLIGNGKGAAEFFIGNFGGKTHCSLTLYPISGGDSSLRKVTLKFDWPDFMA